MKLPQPFTICDLRFTIGKKSAPPAVPNRQSSIVNRQSRGVALIITLIMLSVTLVMALAFLALSSRERSAVTTNTDITTAKNAVDSALAAAQARMMASILATNTAAYNYGLLVSTNYINAYGFIPGVANPTNVNYDYTFNNSTYSAADLEQNIANLEILPRAPVFVVTNTQTGQSQFRFYLDLNRDDRFEDSGWITNKDNSGVPIKNADGSQNYVYEVAGDPQWIGVLQHPDEPHSPNNQFIARYCYFAMPVGNSLDLNYIHNQAVTEQVNPTNSGSVSDGYFRNQGVGSWEINLAAFLADLNTNQWLPDAAPDGIYYAYYQPDSQNRGYAFDDARALLSWRYNYNYNNLASADSLFFNAANVWPYDNIDEYDNGPLQITTTNILESFQRDQTRQPWAGADNPNRFYDLPDELFNSAQSWSGFVNRLQAADGGPSTYDGYTYYRLLSQLGTDSTPADRGKIDLNYSNAVVNYNADGVATSINIVPGAETNLVPWNPLDFFTAAANEMLRTYTTNWFQGSADDYYTVINGSITNIFYQAPSNYLATYYNIHTNYFSYVNAEGYHVWNDRSGYGLTNVPAYGITNQIPALVITNIPVYINGQFVYSPAVNRVLQLAANLYDASTNSPYPSVFRPIFWVEMQNGYKNVYIDGYQQVTPLDVTVPRDGATGNQLQPPLDPPVRVTYMPLGQTTGLRTPGGNVYGVPWIIGAKKGLPAFNQLSLIDAARVTRKLMVTRTSTDPATATYYTNQMYIMSISNNIGVSFWNPYNTSYPRPVKIYAADTVLMNWTNGANNRLGFTNYYIPVQTINPWLGSQWIGSPPNSAPQAGFYRTNWSFGFIEPSIYRFNTATLVPLNSISGPAPASETWETTTPPLPPLPQMGLNMTNYFQAVILDGNHVIDYVQLRSPINNGNLTQALADPAYTGPPQERLQWSVNAYQPPDPMTYGVYNQLEVSLHYHDAPVNEGRWATTPIPGLASTSPEAESQFFFGFFNPSFQYGGINYTNAELTNQAPYTPTRIVYNSYLLQANDPLVHYLASDLNSQNGTIAVWNNEIRTNGAWYHSDDPSREPLPQVPPTPVKGRYQPWGRNSQMAQFPEFNVDQDAYNLTCKDPLVWGADNWDFPTNKYPTVGWIGRVHRGTPWQTVYLKAHNVLHTLGAGISPNPASGTNTWAVWTGDYNNYDAANSGPLQDRLLFDLFTAAPNDNATRGALSVNAGVGESDGGLAAWSALFSGMVALTNATVYPPFNTTVTIPVSNSWTVIQPAGVAGVDSALGYLVTNINYVRSVFTNADGVVGTFEHKGDILSVPALTENSPFLNWNNVNQQQKGISDEVYEWLPQQMMGLLRGPTDPRYVIYCYGQALRPAPNGTVLTSGLVTNYQVVAESDARAVVSVHESVTNTVSGPVTNYTTQVESYNELPPQ